MISKFEGQLQRIKTAEITLCFYGCQGQRFDQFNYLNYCTLCRSPFHNTVRLSFCGHQTTECPRYLCQFSSLNVLTKCPSARTPSKTIRMESVSTKSIKIQTQKLSEIPYIFEWKALYFSWCYFFCTDSVWTVLARSPRERILRQYVHWLYIAQLHSGKTFNPRRRAWASLIPKEARLWNGSERIRSDMNLMIQESLLCNSLKKHAYWGMVTTAWPQSKPANCI